MTNSQRVDINLFFHNEIAYLDQTIRSIVDQTWTSWQLTLIDDGSTDGSTEVAEAWAGRDPRIRLKRLRANHGIVGAYRRAFAEGDADFVMPKSGDDLIAPDFIERVMTVLISEPETVMCHAGAVNIDDAGTVTAQVPSWCYLNTSTGDAVARALHVMERYTFSPAFWGIYRRKVVDMAHPPMACGGWDHAFVAEIALYGNIRHVPEPLFQRRGGPVPLNLLARSASLSWSRTRSEGDIFTDYTMLVPLATCVWAHAETFALARVSAVERAFLIEAARRIFQLRWGDQLRAEAASFRAHLPRLLTGVTRAREAGAPGSALRQKLDLDRLVAVLDWVTAGLQENAA